MGAANTSRAIIRHSRDERIASLHFFKLVEDYRRSYKTATRIYNVIELCTHVKSSSTLLSLGGLVLSSSATLIPGAI